MTTEDLYKNSFDGYRVDPPPGVWKGVNRRLATKSFLTPGLGHFNILYVAAAAAIAVAVMWPTSDSTMPADTGNQAISVSDSATGDHDQTSRQQPSYNENVAGGISVSNPKYNGNLHKTEQKSDSPAQHAPSDTAAEPSVAATSSEPEIHRTTHSQQPMPDFTSAFHASQHEGCAPLTIILHNLSQNTEYSQWSLGNGETSYEQDLSVTYDEPGTYIISLRSVSGTYAKTSYDTIRVSAHQHAEIAVAISGMTIIAEARNVSGGSIVWDFGDKTQLMGKKNSHTYSAPGVYDITLTVTNDVCTDTITKRITIKEPEFSIKFPNAIVASRSGRNAGNYNSASPESKAFFVPKGNIDNISKYSLAIYTRDGKQVFATSNPRDAWNGYYNDMLLPRGVYVYKCQYEFINGESYNINGYITLLWE